MSIPVIPVTAPFDELQRAWLNGFLAGLFSTEHPLSAPAGAAASLGPLLFLYGTQTGGAEALARRFAKAAAKRGFESRVLGMESHGEIDLSAESRVAIITSTYGEGEMPDNAQAFWAFLRNGSAPRLEQTEYSILALGDRNYTHFCQAGKDFDARFEALGARRVHPRIDCDVDYEAAAEQWIEGVLKAFSGDSPGEIPAAGAEPAPELQSYGKSNPFPATLKTNRLLNGPGSAKETRHFEIALEGSGLDYEVGDALGVVPANCPEFVEEILQAAGLDGEEAVKTPGGTEKPLRLALIQDFDLRSFLEKPPSKATGPRELVDGLRRLQSRLYSISSSPKAHPGEVHLTVAIVRYELDGRARKGVCSTFLADRASGNVPVFIHKSPHFKLPQDPATPVIMVGPGTGVAPFRAFLEERRATGATGRNWLFFGDQHAATDFLYREELEAMKTDGLLTRLDLAFSRDQAEKIYVQDRMCESAAELWTWLNEGASFYVCGDAKRMARDVDAALHAVAERGGRSTEEAAEFVKQLRSEKRYLRDVY